VHLQPAYKDNKIISKDMSVTNKIAKKVISLPIYPELSFKDVKRVINTIKKFYNSIEKRVKEP